MVQILPSIMLATRAMIANIFERSWQTSLSMKERMAEIVLGGGRRAFISNFIELGVAQGDFD